MRQLFVLEFPVNSIQNASDLFTHIKTINIDYNQEHFIIFTLNTKNQIINAHIITIGILDAGLIHPREIFRKAILDNSKSIIIAHNHPSSNLKPSLEDESTYHMLINAGEIIGIPVIDSIIFNEKEFYSMKV